MRNSNQTAELESNILKRVRTGSGISRVQLARELEVSPSTVSAYVERLMVGGFLTESATTTQDMGRPPKLLYLNPSGGEFIGVDFEARHIMATAVDFSDKPLRQVHKLLEERDPVDEIVGKIEAAIAEVLPQDKSRLLAIGVGVPGIVDVTSGVALDYKYLPNWKEVPLAERLKQRFGVQVHLENTMRTMALAEMWFGQGRGYTDFLCICIRSGISAGMVLNGHLHFGGTHRAGELGRWRYPVTNSHIGPELQDIASARSIQKAVQQGIAQGQSTVLNELGYPPALEDIMRAAHRKDPLTLQVIGEAANALGAALGHLTLAVDPVKIVMAGQLTPLGETFLQPLRDAITAILSPSGMRTPAVVNSTMGEYIGALGAAALALHEWKPAPRV